MLFLFEVSKTTFIFKSFFSAVQAHPAISFLFSNTMVQLGKYQVQNRLKRMSVLPSTKGY